MRGTILSDSAAPVGLDVLTTISHKIGGGRDLWICLLSNLARQLELALKAPADGALLEAAFSALLTCLADCNSAPGMGEPNTLRSVDEPSPSRAVVISAGVEPRVIPASHAGVAHSVLADDDSILGMIWCECCNSRIFMGLDRRYVPLCGCRAYKPLAAIVDMVFRKGGWPVRNPFTDYEAAQGPPLPVIFISACRDFDVRLASVRAGGNILPKTGA